MSKTQIEAMLTPEEWHAVEAARTASAVLGGEPLVPYDIVAIAQKFNALRNALRPFADIADKMQGYRGESPLWAIIDECETARAVLEESAWKCPHCFGTEGDHAEDCDRPGRSQ